MEPLEIFHSILAAVVVLAACAVLVLAFFVVLWATR